MFLILFYSHYHKLFVHLRNTKHMYSMEEKNLYLIKPEIELLNTTCNSCLTGGSTCGFTVSKRRGKTECFLLQGVQNHLNEQLIEIIAHSQKESQHQLPISCV